jgi:nitrogen fixation protein NifX
MTEATRFRVAVASSDGAVVNRHFGRAREFLIYERQKDGSFLRTGVLPVTPLCEDFSHSEENLKVTAGLLADYDAVLVSRIGSEAEEYMLRAGVPVYVITDYIEGALAALTKYLEKNI